MLSQERLKQVLDYKAETGTFTWKVRISFGVGPGKVSGLGRVRGYARVSVDGIRYYAHRLAWFYHYGEWPPEIDHINGDRADNRIANLRECTRQQNLQNSKRRRNGLKGVCWIPDKKKWRSTICANRRKNFLGHFNTEEEAHAAYVRASHSLHGQFARPE